ncbi:EamA family transporter [Microbacterium invictum]|uniref:DME family drug/metabolite transporter n=1 Tax=Microbacterium invictum TaxID=515415 RepID=A0AA40VKG2_9MICO|nr:EamA family transporter [Microbacterium invictum]MBB4138481.1 DME family drug/metabolite transporter [Microbacterium invictum]
MLHVLAVLAAALLFGTTGTSQALGPDGTTPLSIGVVRMVIGGTVLAVIAFLLAARHTRRRQMDAGAARPSLGIRPLSLMVLTGACLAIYQPLFFLGTSVNGVAVGTVVALGSAPVLAGLLEWALTRRLPTATWIGATALATVGVVLLGFGGGADAAGGTDPVGLLGSIGAGASFAVIANAQRRLLDAGWDPFTVVGAMGASSAVLCAFAIPFVTLDWLGTTSGLIMALWLGVATIGVAYILFTWGLSGLTAATAATLTLGEPLTASVLGITVLGERLSVLAIVGLAVLAAGLALLAWGSRSPRDPAPFAVEG